MSRNAKSLSKIALQVNPCSHVGMGHYGSIACLLDAPLSRDFSVTLQTQLSTTRSPIRTVSRRSDHGVDPSARELADIADLHPVVANERPKNIRILR
jgi:hypothetical protein